MYQVLLSCVAISIAAFSLWFQQGTDDQLRTWKSSTGNFEVQATLISQTGSEVVLRKEDGKEITVPLSKLSDADRAFLKKLDRKPTPNKQEMETLKQMATKFYDSLRSDDRDDARALLTEPARQLADEKKSHLAKLPKPDEGSRGFRVGKVTVDGNTAEVVVNVRAGGEQQKTTLQFNRNEGDQWKVFAISAKLGAEEHAINLETPVETTGNSEPPRDKIAELMGKSVEFNGLTLDGSRVSLEQYQGKVVLIDFWATWCGPCRAEIPNILENYEKYHDQGFEVLAVSVDQDLEKLAEFVDDEKPPWVVLADRHPKNKKSMATAFGVSGIPAFILVGADGTVIDVHCRGPKLGKKLAELFGS